MSFAWFLVVFPSKIACYPISLLNWHPFLYPSFVILGLRDFGCHIRSLSISVVQITNFDNHSKPQLWLWGKILEQNRYLCVGSHHKFSLLGDSCFTRPEWPVWLQKFSQGWPRPWIQSYLKLMTFNLLGQVLFNSVSKRQQYLQVSSDFQKSFIKISATLWKICFCLVDNICYICDTYL